MRAIFISYRREDAEGQAGRLFDDLTAHFGEDTVFMDVAGIEPGRDFRRVIDQHVASCGVLLAMIGRNWIDAADESGQRRLEDPMDFVRLETASALKRDIPVIPVLVHGARMPRADRLPADLADLAYRNGVELTHARWDSDVQVLLKALRPYVESQKKNAVRAETAAPAGTAGNGESGGAVLPSGVPRTVDTAPAGTARPQKKSLGVIIAGSAVAIVVAVGAYAWYQKSSETAENMRQTALLEEARKQAAAADLEAQRQAEAKTAAAELEAGKRAQEKAAADLEAQRQAREKAAKDLEAQRRARENPAIDIRPAQVKPSPPVARSQGELTILEGRFVDLDDGKVGGPGGGDFGFPAAGREYIEPVNGASMAIVRIVSPDGKSCAAAKLSASRLLLADLPQNTFVCVRTNQGRYAFFRVLEAVEPGTRTLKIRYLTWN